MAKSYFKTLGLDAPPKDRRDVKRAYSARLKVTRPEDDPEGFMRLRDAHDLAMAILARQAEDAEMMDDTPSVDYAQMVEDAAEDAAPSDTAYAQGASSSLAAPVQQWDNAEESDTSYALGPTPTLDAPSQAPVIPPLLDKLQAIFDDPKARNDRDAWNNLFRAARQLGLDEYVDFEDMLLGKMLQIHGFFDFDNPLRDTPQKMPKFFDPSITASLFRTMNWDKVSKHDSRKTYQIEWLEQRMGLVTPGQTPVNNLPRNTAPTNIGGWARWFWPILGGLTALALLGDLLG